MTKYRTLGGALLACAIATGSYFIGHNEGFSEGERRGKEKVVMSLCYDRYDIQQNAKFAGSLENQNKILAYSGAIERVFQLLYDNGHFTDLSEYVREEAIGHWEGTR